MGQWLDEITKNFFYESFLLEQPSGSEESGVKTINPPLKITNVLQPIAGFHV